MSPGETPVFSKSWLVSIGAFCLLSVPALSAQAQKLTLQSATQPSEYTRQWAKAAEVAHVRLAQLEQRYPQTEAVWRSSQAGPEVVTGLQVAVPGAKTDTERAVAFLRSYEGLLGVGSDELQPIAGERMKGQSIVRFTQQARVPGGFLPVYNRMVVVALDDKSEVISVTSDAAPLPAFVVGSLTVAQARQAALAHLKVQGPGRTDLSQLPALPAIFLMPAQARHVIAVEVTVTPRVDRRVVLVDAVNGQILRTETRQLH